MSAPHRSPSAPVSSTAITPERPAPARPDRGSTRVTRKSPMGWLPWALLAAIAALLLLVLLLVNAVDDDGAEGPAGDSLGQVSGSDGDSPVGSDGGAQGGSSEGGSPEGGSGGQAPDAEALSRVTEAALLGGGSLPAAPVAQSPAADALTAQPGVAGTVLFAEGSAEIDAAGQQVVAAAAESLQAAGVTTVEVVGHTDVIAGDPVNDTLSQERADAVAAALAQAVPGLQATTAARGQDEPVATNETEQGRQLNRRAVISAAG